MSTIPQVSPPPFLFNTEPLLYPGDTALPYIHDTRGDKALPYIHSKAGDWMAN